jgi:uncharacterized protein YidB (DUF937 family)
MQGKNLPGTPVSRTGLGSDLLNQIAAKTGLSPGETSSRLAGLFPDLVASVSPDGKIETVGSNGS